MAQAVEHLLCKNEALSLNHSPTKKKKKEDYRPRFIMSTDAENINKIVPKLY
jgi:hypothetical protein